MILWWTLGLAADVPQVHDVETATGLVALYLDVGKVEEARSVAAHQLALHPNDPQALRLAEQVAAKPKSSPTSWVRAGATSVAWPSGTASGAGAIGAGLSWNDRVWTEATVRGVWFDGGQRQEGWTHIGVAKNMLGGEVLAAGFTDQTWLLGGRVFGTTMGLTLSTGLIHTSRTDGSNLQWDLGANLSLGRGWTATAALEHTRVDEDLGWTGVGGVSWSNDAWTVGALGRAGRSYQPVRWFDSVVWDLDEPITATAAISLQRRIAQSFHLSAQMEVLNVAEAGVAASPSIGITFSPRPGANP
jgi:hypothetical protein